MASESTQARQRRPLGHNRNGSEASISSNPRQRTKMACKRCRTRKIRCIGGIDDDRACESCSSARAQCQFVRANAEMIADMSLPSHSRLADQPGPPSSPELFHGAQSSLHTVVEVHSPTRGAHIRYPDFLCPSAAPMAESLGGPWPRPLGLPEQAYNQAAPAFTTELPHQAEPDFSHTLYHGATGPETALHCHPSLHRPSLLPGYANGPATEHQASAAHHPAGSLGVPTTLPYGSLLAGEAAHSAAYISSPTSGYTPYALHDGSSGAGGAFREAQVGCSPMTVPRYSMAAPYSATDGTTLFWPHSPPVSQVGNHEVPTPLGWAGQNDYFSSTALLPPVSGLSSSLAGSSASLSSMLQQQHYMAPPAVAHTVRRGIRPLMHGSGRERQQQ